MTHFKNIYNGFVESLSTENGQTEITEAEYNEILAIAQTAPTAPEGYEYKLRASDLEWELVELPPEPQDEDITADEALDIILGVSE